MSHPTLRPDGRAALEALTADLRRVFGNRLLSVSAYGLTEDPDADLRSIVLVDRLAFEDIAACVPLAARWNDRGLAVPLLLERDEFTRSLDVFPLEYGDIIAHHVLIHGRDPFAGVSVSEQDRRRGCELQAKSHLIHLREGYLESGGDGRAIGALMARSAPALASLLGSIDRLEPGTAAAAGLDQSLVGEVARAADTRIAEPSALFTRYLDAVERLWQMVDRWRP